MYDPDKVRQQVLVVDQNLLIKTKLIISKIK